jgi:hypothetical protein
MGKKVEERKVRALRAKVEDVPVKRVTKTEAQKIKGGAGKRLNA